MAGLIDNVMDFARARLGAGMQLKLKEQPLEPVIRQIVAEFENVHPDRVIETVVNVPGPVRIDADRIGQMLSNLLGNAISYGAADKPIRVLAQTTGAGFDLSVANKGAPIPADAIPRLFTAFDRGDVLPNQKGLGLGLYIAQEIARAHGGLIVASSMRMKRCSPRRFRQARPAAEKACYAGLACRHEASRQFSDNTIMRLFCATVQPANS
ncbi:HAMP domain-containing sensor histidine kinase [Bradyrhizobium sp. 151]|uniref:sensor histidine kinase n=1 Tax=Bradyrhizobium sp. 151 TaxID=2782626 RepID=UPI00320954BD|nr:HAMP domain-containing histidine kinase [Bradyrhizobium sp. 151]